MTEPITPANLHARLKNFILADGLEPVFDAEKSHGAYLHDARTGRDYLDLFSFFATQPVSFNHPGMANDGFIRKLGRFSVNRPTLSDIYTPEYGQFVETFGRLCMKGIFRYAFFVEGGSLGVENALKAAMDWKVRKNLAARRGERGTEIIHFRDAFHGRSGYSLSMTNTFDPNKYQYFAKFSWPRIPSPKLAFPLTPANLGSVEEGEHLALAEIRKVLSARGIDIAAILVEPIQAEGGDNHFRAEFLRELRRIADESDVLLIFDEVQTGIGLTGRMWCFEHFGVVPDLLSFGKKAQVAGFLAGPRVDEVPENVFHVPSRINSTWGGNLTDMIRATRYLEIIEEERLVENAETVGAYFMDRLTEWAARRPRVSNVRGRGLMIAFDLPDGEIRSKLRKKVMENGAIILPCGARSLRLRPHLDFCRADVDRAMEILQASELAL